MSVSWPVAAGRVWGWLRVCRSARGSARCGASSSRSWGSALLGESVQKSLDEPRVELRAGLAAQLGRGVFDRARGVVRALLDHRVEGVRHLDDARHQRDVFAAEAVRVA